MPSRSGLFPEILRGQQRIALANTIFSLGMVSNLALAAIAVHYHWGLKAIFLIAILCTYLPDLICGISPCTGSHVRFAPDCSRRAWSRETMSFSALRLCDQREQHPFG